VTAALATFPLLASLFLYAAGPRLARLLPGRLAAVLLTCSALVAALSTGLILGMLGFLVAAENPTVSAAAHWSAPVLHASYPVPMGMGLAGGTAVTVLIAAAGLSAVRLTRQLAAAALICRRLGPAPGGLVVVRDGHPTAYAVPGLSGRIVVTTAMLHVLTADERRALLAHEAAHLQHHHYAYVQLSELAAAANPLLRPTASAVRVAVERWADDVAATQTGDRRLVARTLARAGLARAEAPWAVPGAALAAADTEIQQRVNSLLSGPSRRRPTAALLVVAITLACAASAVVVGDGVHGVFEVAQAAYAHSR
jgi:hypothetical protein